jgi:hypothetical protein
VREVRPGRLELQPVQFEEEAAECANKAMLQLVREIVGLLSRKSHAVVASVLLLSQKQLALSFREKKKPFSPAAAQQYEQLFARVHLLLILDLWRRNSDCFLSNKCVTEAVAASTSGRKRCGRAGGRGGRGGRGDAKRMMSDPATDASHGAAASP